MQLFAGNFPGSRFLSAQGAQRLHARLAELGIAGGAVYEALAAAWGTTSANGMVTFIVKKGTHAVTAKKARCAPARGRGAGGVRRRSDHFSVPAA